MTTLLNRSQVRRVDELAISRYGICGLVLMENAGRNAAAIIEEEFGPRGSTMIVCGRGNNGGDGFVIARHLHNAGWNVGLLICGDVEGLSPDALINFQIVKAMQLDVTVAIEPAEQQEVCRSIHTDEIVIDALLGTGFEGTVRDETAELIRVINGVAKRAVIAVDVPSGLDCDTGRPGGESIRADLTITFVAQKTGFDSPGAGAYLGKIKVADIGAPRELIAEVLRGTV
ncbi:MAG: NAD(P)H-hydrate epimerase [Planctomycetes bacterium]|nr:NAD(P)H-hydrate epimerase [Planctomycetota bacterium]